MPPASTKNQKLYVALKMFDVNGDGTLNRNELKALLSNKSPNGAPMTDDEIRKFLILFDKNGDGKISIAELTQAIGSEKEAKEIESGALRIQQARAKKRLGDPPAGHKLWYNGPSETRAHSTKVTYGTWGEVVGPSDSGLMMRMKFAYNIGMITNVYYSNLRRTSPKEGNGPNERK
uniref:EF-hand domain-containing protein n=1 Tax=Haptolina brevifila TaxID=156173 RepID=A0A7S2J012_9EUKA